MRQLPADQRRAAVMMHTELAGVWLLLGQTAPAVTQIGNADRLVAIMIANDRGMEPTRAFAIRWYAFITGMYAAQGQVDAADRFVRVGLAAFPRAAELYVARGSIQEMRAGMDESDHLGRAITDRDITRDLTRLLEAAAADFQHALDLDGALALAHLHRGRVHHLLGDNRASHDLETALAGATDDRVRYLAHLFLGAVAERRNDLDAARREYEAARAVGPYQTSYIALSRVEGALGRSDRARDIALEYAHLTDKVDDPWWDYRLGEFNAGALSWLRHEARR